MDGCGYFICELPRSDFKMIVASNCMDTEFSHGKMRKLSACVRAAANFLAPRTSTLIRYAVSEVVENNGHALACGED